MIALLLATCLVVLSAVLQEKIGLNLADEGFLWNGVLRTTHGKIPILDFKSYDPGRFYWCAAWTHVFGRGLLGIRRAVSVFQCLGLWVGLLAAGTVIDSLWQLALLGLLMTWWMQPRHKRFDHATSLIGIFTAVSLIGNPIPLYLFLAGVFVGFAAFMGRNHGTYAFASFAIFILVIGLKIEPINLWLSYAVWLAGILVGYSPMLLMWIFIPDMFRTYWFDKVLVFVRRGTVNLPLPVPWPWRINYANLSLPDRLSKFFLGLHALLLPLFYLGTLPWVLTTPPFPGWSLLTASSVIGLFYMHHFFTRADLPHLCQITQPFILGVVAAAYSQPDSLLRAAVVIVLLIAGFFTARPLVPLMRMFDERKKFVPYTLNGETFRIPKQQANLLDTIRTFVGRNLGPDDLIFIAPTYPMLYPILQRETPVHSDFLLFPELEQKQREIIEDLTIKGVDWVLIYDFPLDQRDDLRFKNTHPYVWAYIQHAFEPKVVEGLRKCHTFYERKKRADSIETGEQPSLPG